MKSRTGAVVLVLAALAGGLAFSQNPPVTPPAAQDPSLDRITKLETDLAAAKLRIEALSTQLAESKKQLSATVKYVEQQAKAAGAMAEALDRSEREGFTFGINPDSRHTLLRGWREQLAMAQANVPEVEAPPPAAGKLAPRKP